MLMMIRRIFDNAGPYDKSMSFVMETPPATILKIPSLWES